MLNFLCLRRNVFANLFKIASIPSYCSFTKMYLLMLKFWFFTTPPPKEKKTYGRKVFPNSVALVKRQSPGAVLRLVATLKCLRTFPKPRVNDSASVLVVLNYQECWLEPVRTVSLSLGRHVETLVTALPGASHTRISELHFPVAHIAGSPVGHWIL